MPWLEAAKHKAEQHKQQRHCGTIHNTTSQTSEDKGKTEWTFNATSGRRGNPEEEAQQ